MSTSTIAIYGIINAPRDAPIPITAISLSNREMTSKKANIMIDRIEHTVIRREITTYSSVLFHFVIVLVRFGEFLYFA